MCPIFVKVFSIQIDSWAVTYLLGMLIGLVVSIQIDKELKLEIGYKKLTTIWLVVIYFGGVLGCRLLQLIVLSLADESLAGAGKAFYGGVIFIITILILLARFWKLSILKLLDILFLAGCLSGAIGRFGCLMNGCCRGDTVNSWGWGINYPEIDSLDNFPTVIDLLLGRQLEQYNIAFQDTPFLHPAPVYYSIGFLLLFVILYFKRKQIVLNPGRIFFMWLVLHGILRVLLEMIRNNPPYVYGKINISVIISIVGIFLGSILLITRKPLKLED